MTDAQAIKSLKIAVLCNWLGYGNIWRDFLRYMLDGTLPPGTRVYCDTATNTTVSIPDFCNVLVLAQQAALALKFDSTGYTDADTLATAILASYGM